MTQSKYYLAKYGASSSIQVINWYVNYVYNNDFLFNRATDDLDSVGELCKATVQCENCGKRQVIDQQVY